MLVTKRKVSLADLRPDTTYSVRVQAVNRVGRGGFSPVLRLATRPLHPAPPRLECLSASHNTLKLKWADGKWISTVIFLFGQEVGRGGRGTGTRYPDLASATHCSVAESPLFWAAPAPDGQGPGADSSSGSDLLGLAPAPGKKGGSGSIH